MQIWLTVLGWFVLSYIIYLTINRYLQERRHDAERKRLAAKMPPIIPNTLPLGIEQVKGAFEADKAERYLDYIHEWFIKMGGDYGYKVLGKMNYMTCDPKNIQAILATQFQDFGTGEIRRKIFFPMLGNGIFTTDGKMWEHSRQMMRPQFARDQISDLKLEERHVQNLFEAIPMDAEGWTSEVELQTLFFRLTLDSACEFLLGESPDSQVLLTDKRDKTKPQTLEGRPDSAAFAHAFDRGQKWLLSRARLSAFYYFIDGTDFRRSNKICQDFVDYFVAIALNKSDLSPNQKDGNGSDQDNDKKDQKYVFLDALTTQTRDPIELRSQLLNILLAGRDTTASLLGWTFWELARRPAMYASLRQSILSEFGTSTDNITVSSLKSCAPLQHLLQESLRLNPVVPINMRQALKDTTLPRGGGADKSSPIFIPKGTEIWYCVYIMHRRQDIWGDDALEFKPERWVGRKPGWEYLPFNGGPRMCLGRQFALAEAGYVTVRMLQRFDELRNCDPSGSKHHLTLTDCPGGEGVKVRLHMAT